MKDEGRLPRLSSRLGRLTRTNSESLLGAVARSTRSDYTRGVAITSSFYPEPDTHVEPVRYGKGSSSMGLLQSVLTAPQPGRTRWRAWVREVVEHPGDAIRLMDLRRWSERAVISLVMQTVDSSLTLTGTRSRLGRWRLTTRPGDSSPAPTYLPVAQDVVRRAAARMGGIAAGSVFENLDRSLTAHFVGGCTIGADRESGVIDAYHRVFGHVGLHIVDGSAITANLGVNPSLTITAQAERAMALWPNRANRTYGRHWARPTSGASQSSPGGRSCPTASPAPCISRRMSADTRRLRHRPPREHSRQVLPVVGIRVQVAGRTRAVGGVRCGVLDRVDG